MPDPVTHTNITAPIISGGLSLLIGTLFDISPALLFVAFVGAWIGVALRDPVPEFPTRADAVKFFFKTLMVVLMGTIASAYVIPIITEHWPSLAQKSVSAFTGFILVYFYTEIIGLFRFALDGLKGVITRFLGKA